MICIGRNYAAHAAEGGAETPTFPEVFFRGPTSLVTHQGAIVRPKCSEMLDFEAEIAFVMGKSCRHATEANALDYIAGYTLFNEATIRNYQKFSSQWTIGKNFDSTGAFGPELVTSDELPDGIAGMSLTTRLNGELMQDGRTDDLVDLEIALRRFRGSDTNRFVRKIEVRATPIGLAKHGDRFDPHLATRTDNA